MKKLLILSLIIFLPSSPTYASGISGTPCTVQQLNQTLQSGNYTYRCLLINNKFIWGGGTPVPGTNPKTEGTLITPKSNTPTQKSQNSNTPTQKSNRPQANILPEIINKPASILFPEIIQLTSIKIWGNPSPGELLRVEGGEWESPTPLKISYEWLFCTGGSADYYSGGPAYFEKESDIDLKSKQNCKKINSKNTGKTFLIPEKTIVSSFITVRQYVKLTTWKNGRGFYTYARSVQTNK